MLSISILLKNNINYILISYIIALAIGLKWLFDIISQIYDQILRVQILLSSFIW
jgi:hypothetical protein